MNIWRWQTPSGLLAGPGLPTTSMPPGSIPRTGWHAPPPSLLPPWSGWKSTHLLHLQLMPRPGTRHHLHRVPLPAYVWSWTWQLAAAGALGTGPTPPSCTGPSVGSDGCQLETDALGLLQAQEQAQLSHFILLISGTFWRAVISIVDHYISVTVFLNFKIVCYTCVDIWA